MIRKQQRSDNAATGGGAVAEPSPYKSKLESGLSHMLSSTPV